MDMWIACFVHLSIHGPLRCFHILAMVNSAALNRGVQMFLQDSAFNSFRYVIACDFLFFLKIFYCIFSPLPFSPLKSSHPSNHHCIVHVHESFLLFAQSLQPLTSPPVSCHPALCGSVSVLQTKLTFSLFIRLYI